MSNECPNCKTEMVFVGDWTDEYDDIYLYQCPKCKTVKLDKEARGWEDYD